jgi:hypothetical protein
MFLHILSILAAIALWSSLFTACLIAAAFCWYNLRDNQERRRRAKKKAYWDDPRTEFLLIIEDRPKAYTVGDSVTMTSENDIESILREIEGEMK